MPCDLGLRDCYGYLFDRANACADEVLFHCLQGLVVIHRLGKLVAGRREAQWNNRPLVETVSPFLDSNSTVSDIF